MIQPQLALLVVGVFLVALPVMAWTRPAPPPRQDRRGPVVRRQPGCTDWPSFWQAEHGLTMVIPQTFSA
jgi:hypothetical protein